MEGGAGARDGPNALCFTEKLPIMNAELTQGAARGAYVVQDFEGTQEQRCILLANGSEVSYTQAVDNQLLKAGMFGWYAV